MENKYYLFTPKLDWLLIGGAALIFYVILIVINMIYGVNVYWQSEIVYLMLLLAFFVNSPHFLISYLIFYRENRSNFKLFNNFSIVGVYIPIILLILILFGLYSLQKFYFNFLMLAMFFLVGWHYIKQAYGCFIVYSAGNKIFYNKNEQIIVKFSLYPLWIFSFINIFTQDSIKDYWGFKYSFPSFLNGFGFIVEIISIIGFFSLLIMFLYNFIFLSKKVNLIALLPLLVIFFWLSPLFWNPYFYIMIPFFHSLQYYLFSGAYTKSKILNSENKLSEFLKWWGIAFILGAFFFEFLPNFLDKNLLIGNIITPHIFLLSFILFINIHHYFIDSVIWRSGNKNIRDNLKFISDNKKPA